MTSPIDSVVMHLPPEKRNIINNVLFSNQDKDSAKAALLMFKQTTYGVSQALQRDIVPQNKSPAPLAKGRVKSQVPFPKYLAADLAANMMVNSILYNQEASADEAPGTPLVQDLRQVVTSDRAVSGILTAVSLEDLNSRSNYNAYQLPHQATVSLFNSALSAQDIQAFNELSSEHSKKFVRDKIRASLEAGRVSNGNRSLWALPLTATGVTGAELLGVMSEQEEDQTQEEELLSTSNDFLGFGKTFTPRDKELTEPTQAPKVTQRPPAQRKRTKSDDEYDQALRQLKGAAKYPNRFPELYARAVKKEERLRNALGTRYPRPDSLLDLNTK